MKFLIILLLTVNCSLLTQVSIEWERRYDGTGNGYDEATTLFRDNSGNLYVCGGSTGSGSGLDYVVIKYDSDGFTSWTARYNGPGNGDDDAYLVKADDQGYVYVTGSSEGAGTSLDYCVVKYSPAGAFIWAYRYNGPGNDTDEVYSLQVDNGGFIYMTGYSKGSSSGYDICTIKLNYLGAEQWVKRINGSLNNDDYGNSIQIDNSGNIYLTGAVTTATDLDYITVKYDNNGNIIWQKFYNGPGNGEDFPSSNVIDASGNVYVVGYSLGTGTNYDYCTIKYNNSGAQQWVTRYNGTANGIDEAWNIILDNQNNVYITGNSAGAGTGDDYASVKYNNNGVQQWAARYNGNGTGDDYCNWIVVDPTGNVYVTGVSQGTGVFDDMATIGYNSSGVQQWLIRYNGPGNEYDSGNSMAIDNTGNVFVAGGSDNSLNTDFIIIKYNSTIGIKPISTEIPDKFSLSQNYPNPFNPSTKIRFSLPSPQGEGLGVRVTIYDILGREVITLVNELLQPGTYEVEWDATKYSSGIYFYTLTTNDPSAPLRINKKMILVK